MLYPNVKALCSEHGVGWSTKKSTPFFFNRPSATFLHSKQPELGKLIKRGALVQVRNRLAVVQMSNPQVTMGLYLACGTLHHPRALPVDSKSPGRQLTFTLNDPVSLLLPSERIGFHLWLNSVCANAWGLHGEQARFNVLRGRIIDYYAEVDNLAKQLMGHQ